MNFRSNPFSACVPVLLAVGFAAGGSPAQDSKGPDLWRDDPAALVDQYLQKAKLHPVEVLLLGTFHFDDQGLDEYKPQHHFDALAKNRQAEIEAIIGALAKFKPDAICVERRPSGQARLDAAFAAYAAGNNRNNKNEITQVGFRLAEQLGHKRVVAVDAAARGLEPRVDPILWARKNNRLQQLMTPLQQLEGGFLKERERFIDRADLTTILRFMNHPKVLATSHAGYLVGGFHAADGKEYPGPDGFITAWHNRNLRIFANIMRTAKQHKRVVVLIGAGHVPILRHCVRSSPECRLVEVADVLPKTDGVTKASK